MRKFGRQTDQRQAFLKSLAANLIIKEKIKTTEARAKEVRSLVEKSITQAKKATLSSRREIARRLPIKPADKLFKEIAPRFKDKKSGYLRITKLGQRLSDGAKMAYVEFIKE